MKKKRLLGKVLSLVLSAAMTVTMLPQDFTLTVRAAEQIEADGEMESQTSTSEEESLEAEPSEPAQESSIAKEKDRRRKRHCTRDGREQFCQGDRNRICDKNRGRKQHCGRDRA